MLYLVRLEKIRGCVIDNTPVDKLLIGSKFVCSMGNIYYIDSINESDETLFKTYMNGKRKDLRWSQGYVSKLINDAVMVFKNQEDIDLHSAILNLKEEIKSMTPVDGFNSPRDYNLVKDVNIKSSILEKWVSVMKERHPNYRLEY